MLIFSSLAMTLTPVEPEISQPHFQIRTALLSQSYSNILPIKQIIDDEWLEKPGHDAGNAFSQSIASASVHYDTFFIGTSQRLDYLIQSNPDTAEGFFLDKQKQNLQAEKDYDVYLSYHQQRSKGMFLGFTHSYRDFDLSVKFNKWDIIDFRRSLLFGSIRGDDQNQLKGELNIEEYYYEKNVLKRKNLNQDWENTGFGYSTDLSLSYSSDNLSMGIIVLDAFNYFEVENVGYTEANINTKGSFIDNAGLNSFRPLLKGIEAATTHDYSLPTRWMTNISYQRNTLIYSTEMKRFNDSNFYAVGLEKTMKYGSVKLGYDFTSKSPSIGLFNSWISFSLAADSSDYEKAKALELGLAINLRF